MKTICFVASVVFFTAVAYALITKGDLRKAIVYGLTTAVFTEALQWLAADKK